ncbi:MAG: hypothetical protein R2799_12495 [Crocinitomicaceae bacterium]
MKCVKKCEEWVEVILDCQMPDYQMLDYQIPDMRLIEEPKSLESCIWKSDILKRLLDTRLSDTRQ